MQVDFTSADLLLHGAYLDTKLENCAFCVTISEFNRRSKTRLRHQIRAMRHLITEKNASGALALLPETFSVIDRSAKLGVIKNRDKEAFRPEVIQQGLVARRLDFTTGALSLGLRLGRGGLSVRALPGRSSGGRALLSVVRPGRLDHVAPLEPG